MKGGICSIRRSTRAVVCILVALAVILPVQENVKAGWLEMQVTAHVRSGGVELFWGREGALVEVLAADSPKGPFDVIGKSDTGMVYLDESQHLYTWYAVRSPGEPSTMSIAVNVAQSASPMQPTNLRTERDADGIEWLKWDASRGARHYIVYALEEDGSVLELGKSLSAQFALPVYVDAFNYGVCAQSFKGKSGISMLFDRQLDLGKYKAVVDVDNRLELMEEGVENTSSPSYLIGEATAQLTQMQVLGLESDVFLEINRCRAEAGLPGLRFRQDIYEAAVFRAEELSMNPELRHTSLAYDTLNLCVEHYTNQHPWWVGECLLGGVLSKPDAAAIVEYWMNSPSHKEALLCPQIMEGAVGIAIDEEGALYVVALPVQWEELPAETEAPAPRALR